MDYYVVTLNKKVIYKSLQLDDCVNYTFENIEKLKKQGEVLIFLQNKKGENYDTYFTMDWWKKTNNK